MHKSIKLNHFEYINIFESCKQPGMDNKSSNSSLKWFLVLKIKIQGFFLQRNVQGSISIHCEVSENKRYVSIM